MPTGHLRTNKRHPKDAERMRIAMEMQRPLDDLRCGGGEEDPAEVQALGTPETVLDTPHLIKDARTTHEIEGVPV